MYKLYIDEFGDDQILKSTPSNSIEHNQQPFVILVGIILKAESLPGLTKEIIHRKKRYFPECLPSNKGDHYLNWLQAEVKGATFKSALRKRKVPKVKKIKRFYKEIFELFEKYEVKILSKCFVKQLDKKIYMDKIYTSCVQNFCYSYQEFLAEKNSFGSIILDSREHHKDKQVAFSVATQKYKHGVDPYSRILEIPTFAADNNHIGLQLADWIVSGLIVPICGAIYVNPFLPDNIHSHLNYLHLKDVFSGDLSKVQYRYSHNGMFRGGIVVSDPNGSKSSKMIFQK